MKELKKFGFEEGLDDGCHKAFIKELRYNDYIAIYKDGNILVDVEDLMIDEEEITSIKELIQARNSRKGR